MSAERPRAIETPNKRNPIILSINGDGRIPRHGPVVTYEPNGWRLRDRMKDKRVKSTFADLVTFYSFLTSPYSPTRGEETRRQLRELTTIASRLSNVTISATVTFPVEVEILSPQGVTFKQVSTHPYGKSEEYTLWINNLNPGRLLYFRYQEKEIAFPRS